MCQERFGDLQSETRDIYNTYQLMQEMRFSKPKHATHPIILTEGHRVWKRSDKEDVHTFVYFPLKVESNKTVQNNLTQTFQFSSVQRMVLLPNCSCVLYTHLSILPNSSQPALEICQSFTVTFYIWRLFQHNSYIIKIIVCQICSCSFDQMF